MTRSIMAHEATVKTAIVEVKALTIAGRQVTLSVFRQLKDEPILDEDTVLLRGVPWGIVNYFWGECSKASEHIHVVWQKGDQLRRACVYPNPSSSQGWRESKAEADTWFRCWVWATIAETSRHDGLTVVNPGYGRPQLRKFLIDRWYQTDFDMELKDLLAWKLPIQMIPRTTRWGDLGGTYQEISLDALELADERDECERSNAERKAQAEAHKAAMQKKIRDAVRLECGSIDPEAIAEHLDEAVRGVIDFEERWKSQYAALAELDHLFIAV